MLLELPDGLFNRVLLEWLTFEEVAKLDSALCNKKLRPEFLHRIDSDSMVFFSIKNGGVKAEDWMLLRKLRVIWIQIVFPEVNEEKRREHGHGRDSC